MSTQQVDLCELTRLHQEVEKGKLGIMEFGTEIHRVFPALRDELVRLREEVVEPRFCTDAAIVEMTNTIIGLRRQLDEAKGLLERIEKVQEMSYGDATSLHLDMIGLSKEIRTFLASLAGTTERKPFKLEASKEWFEKSAEIEGDSEVGAGISPFSHPDQPTDSSLAGRDGGHFSELKDTQEDANQFGSDWGQLTKALGAHGEESCPITGKDTHEDIHERAMQRIRDLVAEEGEAGDLREQLETAKMWIATSANRFETIRETHPSISLDHDISNLRGFLTGKEIKSSFRVLNEGSTEDHPTGILTIQQPEQTTQGEVCLHNWQLSQGAVVYKCTKCGDKTTTPPQEVEGGEEA